MGDAAARDALRMPVKSVLWGEFVMTPLQLTLILFSIWLMIAVAAGRIAAAKRRSAIGWGLLAFFFGPLGLLVVAVMPAAETDRR